MNTAAFASWVRDLRTGEVHLPSEEVTMIRISHNLVVP
jgi:hypothetical protein